MPAICGMNFLEISMENQKRLRSIRVVDKGVGDWRGFALCEVVDGAAGVDDRGFTIELGELWELRGGWASTPAQAAQQAYDAYCAPIDEWCDYGYMLCRLEDEER